jgi:O-methyltransferase
MFSVLKRSAKKLVTSIGFDVVRVSNSNRSPSFPRDFAEDDIEICSKVNPFTMTGYKGIHATCAAVKYVTKNRIPGAIVECGVWKGGSMMAAAYTLLKLGETSRDIFLFDTFEGMTEGSDVDVDWLGRRASLRHAHYKRLGKKWAHGPLEEVKATLCGVGYNNDRIHFVKGKVEDTIPAEAPDTISFLRLDTDFYQSTRHELVHLFPRLSPGGILTVDDYGSWKGARQATDEYIEENNLKIFLSRIDSAARVAVKL